MKRFGIIITLALVLLILPIQTLAQSGCFLQIDSELFCQELTPNQAEEECVFFEDCNLEEIYYENLECSQFAECEKIMCKSTCQEEYAGQCPYGEIPENEQEFWCNEGCCRFEYELGNYCQIEESKWNCEIEAQNNGANQISWDLELDQTSCQELCAAALTLESFTLEKEEFGFSPKTNYSDINNFLDDESEINELENSNPEITTNTDQSLLSSRSMVTRGFLLLFFIGLLVGIIHFSKILSGKKAKGAKEDFNFPLPNDAEEVLSKKESKPTKKISLLKKRPWLFSPKEITKRLNLIRRKHRTKVKERILDETFDQFSKQEPSKITNLEKLNRVVKHHQHKNERAKERAKSEAQKKQAFAKTIKKPIKVKSKPKKLNEIERIGIIEELRSLLRKRK